MCSFAATHRGKVKNNRLITLRNAKQNVNHRACILHFEIKAVAFDSKQRKQASNDGEHLVEYDSLGHPYVMNYSLTSSLNWVLLMSPLMINMLSQSDFIEVDVIYKAYVEFEYLLNALTFKYTTMRCKFDRTCVIHLLFTYLWLECTLTSLPRMLIVDGLGSDGHKRS